jgi:predicted phosphodiesterase
MKIIHVSDIHYRESPENNALLNTAVQQLEELHPDYILITGDLTRDGRDDQFARVRDFINELNFAQVLIIPGNRDASRPLSPSLADYKNMEYFLQTHPEPLSLMTDLDIQDTSSTKAKRPDKYFTYFDNAEFFYRDSQIAATGLNSTPEISTRQMELATQHFTLGQPGELRIFCAHHSFLPVPTKKLKPGDIVPKAADILQTLIELNVDLLCCGHIHRSHVWDLSDGNHRLLCCNAGSLLDTSGKKDNGFLEIEIGHDLNITRRSLFDSRTEQLYHRTRFGDHLLNRKISAQKHALSPLQNESENRSKEKKARKKE